MAGAALLAPIAAIAFAIPALKAAAGCSGCNTLAGAFLILLIPVVFFVATGAGFLYGSLLQRLLGSASRGSYVRSGVIGAMAGALVGAIATRVWPGWTVVLLATAAAGYSVLTAVATRWLIASPRKAGRLLGGLWLALLLLGAILAALTMALVAVAEVGARLVHLRALDWRLAAAAVLGVMLLVGLIAVRRRRENKPTAEASAVEAK
jgi:hypothetical protein